MSKMYPVNLTREVVPSATSDRESIETSCFLELNPGRTEVYWRTQVIWGTSEQAVNDSRRHGHLHDARLGARSITTCKLCCTHKLR